MAKEKEVVSETTNDISKFDKANAQVELSIQTLNPFIEIKDNEAKDQAMEALKVAHSVSKLIEDKRKELVKPYNDTVKKINTYAKDLTTKLDDKINVIKSSVLEFQNAETKRLLLIRIANRNKALEDLGMVHSLDFGGMYSYPGFEESKRVPAVYSRDITAVTDEEFLFLLENVKDAINNLKEVKAKEVDDDLDLFSAFGSEEDLNELQKSKEAVSTPKQINYTQTESASSLKGVTKRWTFEIEDAALVPKEYLIVDETAVREAIKNGTRIISGIKIFQKESLTLR